MSNSNQENIIVVKTGNNTTITVPGKHLDEYQADILKSVIIKEIEEKTKQGNYKMDITTYVDEKSKDGGYVVADKNSGRIFFYARNKQLITGENLKIDEEKGIIDGGDNKILKQAVKEVRENKEKEFNNNIKRIEKCFSYIKRLEDWKLEIYNNKNLNEKQKDEKLKQVGDVTKKILDKMMTYTKYNSDLVHQYRMHNNNALKNIQLTEKFLKNFESVEQHLKRYNYYGKDFDPLNIKGPHQNALYDNPFSSNNTYIKYFLVNSESVRGDLIDKMKQHFITSQEGVKRKHFEFIVAKNFIEEVLSDPYSGAAIVRTINTNNGKGDKGFYIETAEGSIIAYIDNEGNCYKGNLLLQQGIKLATDKSGKIIISNAIKVNVGAREEQAKKLEKDLLIMQSMCGLAKKVIDEKWKGDKPLTVMEKILLSKYFVKNKSDLASLNCNGIFEPDRNTKTGELEKSVLVKNIIAEIDERQKQWTNQLGDVATEIKRINNRKGKQVVVAKDRMTNDNKLGVNTNKFYNELKDPFPGEDSKNQEQENHVMDDALYADENFFQTSDARDKNNNKNVKPKNIVKKKLKKILPSYEIREKDILNKSMSSINIKNNAKKNILQYDV